VPADLAAGVGVEPATLASVGQRGTQQADLAVGSLLGAAGVQVLANVRRAQPAAVGELGEAGRQAGAADAVQLDSGRRQLRCAVGQIAVHRGGHRAALARGLALEHLVEAQRLGQVSRQALPDRPAADAPDVVVGAVPEIQVLELYGGH